MPDTKGERPSWFSARLWEVYSTLSFAFTDADKAGALMDALASFARGADGYGIGWGTTRPLSAYSSPYVPFPSIQFISMSPTTLPRATHLPASPVSTAAALLVAALFLAGCTTADAPQTETAPPPPPTDTTPPPNTSPDGAESYIISPQDGATVSSPVTVRFGLKGMGVAPAGVQMANTGHHHLMIDVNELPDLTAPLLASDKHIHFGKGQTETTVDLDPGTHTLQLILGNWAHTPHDPPVISEKITITVQ